MKRGWIAAMAIGLAAVLAAGSQALAGNGQGGGGGNQCKPGWGNCNVQCQPGRPGCPRPPGSYDYYHGGSHHGNWFYHRPYRLSCGAAEERLEDNGFHNVRAKDCSGGRYRFIATKGGRRVHVVMNSRTGQFWRQ